MPTTIDVANNNYTGAGSFTQALVDAAPGDTINLNSHACGNPAGLTLNKAGLIVHGPGIISNVAGQNTRIAASGVRMDSTIAFYGLDGPADGGHSALVVEGPGTQWITSVVVDGCYFYPGGDDCLALADFSKSTVISNCIWSESDWSLGHDMCNGSSSFNLPDEVLTDGTYRGTFTGCTFLGWYRLPLLGGGPWKVDGNTIYVSALGGIDSLNASAEITNNAFLTQAQPAGAPYWYNVNGACPIRVCGYKAIPERVGSAADLTTTPTNNRLYVAGNTLDGVAKTAAQLTHLYNASTGYDAAGTVPAGVFRGTTFPDKPKPQDRGISTGGSGPLKPPTPKPSK